MYQVQHRKAIANKCNAAATYKIGSRLRIAPDGGDTTSAEQSSDTRSSIEDKSIVQ